MASFTFTSYIKKLLNGGGIDLDTDTIKVALLSSAYTPTRTHSMYSDVSGSEVTGTGYTAGGAAIANKTVTEDDTNYFGVFDGDDVSWPNSTITARYAAIYKDTGTPSTSSLIALIDFGSNIQSSLSTFSIPFNASGILRTEVTV